MNDQNQDVPDPVIPPEKQTPEVIPPENPMPGVIPPTNPAPGVVPPTNQKPILDGPAGVHIYHQSIQGHNIYAQSTYQGRGGEIVDLSNFKKDLATFAFDHYSPAEGKITLQAGRNLRAILVYRKVFRPLAQQENPPKSVSSLQKTE